MREPSVATGLMTMASTRMPASAAKLIGIRWGPGLGGAGGFACQVICTVQPGRRNRLPHHGNRVSQIFRSRASAMRLGGGGHDPFLGGLAGVITRVDPALVQHQNTIAEA